MKTYTIHTDIVQRRFIRVEDQSYFVASYGELKECSTVDTQPIGVLRETTQQVVVKDTGKNKTWTLVNTEQSFRQQSNEQLHKQHKQQWMQSTPSLH